MESYNSGIINISFKNRKIMLNTLNILSLIPIILIAGPWTLDNLLIKVYSQKNLSGTK